MFKRITNYRLFQVFFLLSSLTVVSCQRSSPISMGSVGDYQVGLATSPATPKEGKNEFKIIVKDMSGNTVEGAQVSVQYLMPAMGTMPEMQGSAQASGRGRGEYVAILDLPMEGNWTINVSVVPPGKEQLSAEFAIKTGTSGAKFVG